MRPSDPRSLPFLLAFSRPLPAGETARAALLACVEAPSPRSLSAEEARARRRPVQRPRRRLRAGEAVVGAAPWGSTGGPSTRISVTSYCLYHYHHLSYYLHRYRCHYHCQYSYHYYYRYHHRNRYHHHQCRCCCYTCSATIIKAALQSPKQSTSFPCNPARLPLPGSPRRRTAKGNSS